jgi:hypothetical protein
MKMEVKMNYLFVSKYKGEIVFKYNFENVIDAERHIAELIYIQGSKVKKLFNNVIEVKFDADYSMLIIKQKRGQEC